MKKHIDYRILHDQKIIIEYYSGPISLEDIKEFKLSKLKDKDFDLNYNFLIDIREMQLSYNYESILDLIDFYKSNPQFITKRNSSFLTKTPDQVAQTTIFKLESEIFPMNYSIFSTLSASLEFIGLVTEDKNLIIENILNEMKNTKITI